MSIRRRANNLPASNINRLKTAGIFTAAALFLAACAPNGGTAEDVTVDVPVTETEIVDVTIEPAPGEEDDNEAAAPAVATEGIVRANGGEPTNPLIPSDTNESNGGKIIDLLFDKLIVFDADANPVLAAAESVETEDNQTWRIRVRDDEVFSNGEPVTALSFVRAWDDGALASNARRTSFLFDNIQGFTRDGDALLSENGGLELDENDPQAFTVHLNVPDSDFGLRIGHNGFAPVPESAFVQDADGIYRIPAEFGQNPIGNGPYVLSEWNHNMNALMTVSPTYTGPRTPQNAGVDLIFYTSIDAAYNDLLAGQLDVLDQIPDSAFQTFMTDLDGRGANVPSAVYHGMVIPEFLDHFQTDEEGILRRQAISMAIDRDSITDIIFYGTATPAVDFTAPTIPGFSDSLTGADVLQYNPEEARARWEAANAIRPWDGSFNVYFNADGGHQAWVEAVVNSIRSTLEIEVEPQSIPDFATYISDMIAQNLPGGYWARWRAVYPSIGYFLSPQYGTYGDANDGDFSNPEFDDLVAQALAAYDPAEAQALFDQAQEILLVELPSIPLWYTNATGGWSENVDNVTFGWNAVPMFYQIRVIQ